MGLFYGQGEEPRGERTFDQEQKFKSSVLAKAVKGKKSKGKKKMIQIGGEPINQRTFGLAKKLVKKRILRVRRVPRARVPRTVDSSLFG